MLYATRVMQVIAVAGGRGGRRRPDAAEVENPQKAAKERESACPDAPEVAPDRKLLTV
jgi:hypothetical protein